MTGTGTGIGLAPKTGKGAGPQKPLHKRPHPSQHPPVLLQALASPWILLLRRDARGWKLGRPSSSQPPSQRLPPPFSHKLPATRAHINTQPTTRWGIRFGVCPFPATVSVSASYAVAGPILACFQQPEVKR